MKNQSLMPDVNVSVPKASVRGSEGTPKGVVLLRRLRRTAGGILPVDTTVLVLF